MAANNSGPFGFLDFCIQQIIPSLKTVYEIYSILRYFTNLSWG